MCPKTKEAGKLETLPTHKAGEADRMLIGVVLKKYEVPATEKATNVVSQISKKTGAPYEEVVKTIQKRELFTEKNLLDGLNREVGRLEKDAQKLAAVPAKTENFGTKLVSPVVDKIDYVANKLLGSSPFTLDPVKSAKDRIGDLKKDIKISETRVKILQEFEDMGYWEKEAMRPSDKKSYSI